ncbi:DUF396-domain-containing protein [Exidia glandulosa HHB12029]|uniref:DUF396-domain-containing protein n=1 Tax=Exidia glandulosa HHB12029 TaxID=1314781 RepID=A0A165R3V7_EXIGL|nr:DUF396-domain-containing protein [Exidia glandulosa HHB12029]
MPLLTPLSYLATAACFVFVTLSLASGLLYLAEVIEEHSRAAKIIGQRAIYAIIGLHVLLWAFDSLPWRLVAFSIVCHGVYLQNLGSLWPFISLKSLTFIASCVLVVADHFLWFHYFANAMQEARKRNAATYHRPHTPIPRNSGPSFMEVAAFFGVCIWLVPLFLFLSLSANDNALPTMSMDASRPSTPVPGQSHLSSQQQTPKPSRSSLFKTTFDALIDVVPTRLRPRRNTDREGLIASYHPSRPTSPAPQASPSGSWTFADAPQGTLTPRPRGGSTNAHTNGDFKLAPPPMGLGGSMRRGTTSSVRRTSMDGPEAAAYGSARLSPRIPSARMGLGLADEDYNIIRPSSPLKQSTT